MKHLHTFCDVKKENVFEIQNRVFNAVFFIFDRTNFFEIFDVHILLSSMCVARNLTIKT